MAHRWGTKHRPFVRAVGRLGAVALMAGAAGIGPGAGVASAQPPDEPPPAGQSTSLWLMTMTDDGAGRFANLTCDPAGGSHPEAEAACHDLEAAGGDFTELPGETGHACPDVYDPVTAVAFGAWRGEPVRYRATYGNACHLRLATGPVFQL